MTTSISELVSLQQKYAPNGICFGCGPANKQGLRIQSFVEGDELVARFSPELHHQAFEGVINGGIIGALLDCHSNWAAAWHFMNERQLLTPPCTVTAEFYVKLRRPTPMNELIVRAKVTESNSDRATVEATLSANGKITSTCTGIFVAVKEDHPAYHRW